MSFLLHWRDGTYQIAARCTKFSAVRCRLPLGGAGTGADLKKAMGILMKKLVLLATALAMISGSALAADMPVKAVQAPPPAPVQPLDLDFGQIGVGGLPINGNFDKRNDSFYEGSAKVNITLNDQWAVGFNEYYSPNFLNLGAWGDYASVTAKWTAPSTTFGSSGVGMYISGEFGRQWLGTSDAFYGTTVGTAFGGPFPLGIPEPSYNTWNVGVGFTYKVFTLHLRYSQPNLSKGNCYR